MFTDELLYVYNPTEMDKLAGWLTENGIEFTRRPLYGGEQIICDDWEWDAICHNWSYGGNSGLLETMGAIVDSASVGDEVEGCLTAEEVIERFKRLMEKA